VIGVVCGRAAETVPFQQPPISVPDGYAVELAAAPPLVSHPIMAGFDERGRLYVAETAGVNMQRPELEARLPNFVSRLEDTDGDGRFDKRTTFADRLTFPQGALWHDGWLYVASSGAIWRFADRDDDGVAEVREKIVGSFGYTGNAADVHGCFLGPEGRIWWCEGRHGHDIVDSAGKPISKGKAARIFSCKPDGSDVQVHCGGGMDNPVEIDWTDEGEMLGTVNIFYHQRGDCLVHWMHGGVYPRHDQPEVLAEFRKTGEPLEAVHDYGHVAVSGCCRIRFPLPAGEGTAATFLVTEFNTHKVKQTRLLRSGATFRAETSDFLQAASDDFHPTDVLEDADGSFLVIDTGGWFRIGCPTSQAAKPNILGAIYRVRRADAQRPDDPRGLKLEWSNLAGGQLVALLGDARPAVRERAVAALARQGDGAIAHLSWALAHKDAPIRRNAIWALTRIATPQAQGSVRLLGLADKDSSVLAAATYSAGAMRDAAAVKDLVALITAGDTPPHIRREAATSLGRIGNSAGVQPILEALHQDSDRVLEHALIYALIEIADRGATAKGLASDSPRVRRAALIALDQMPEGQLSRDEVAALLDTSDHQLLTAALDVISRRPGWSDELIALADKLLAQKELSDVEQSLLAGALVGLARNEKVQTLVAAALGRNEMPASLQLLLLDVMARSDVRPLPPSWTEQIGRLMVVRSLRNKRVAEQAIELAGAAAEGKLDGTLREISRTGAGADLRVAALAAIAPRLSSLSAQELSMLLTALGSGTQPQVRRWAAQALSEAPLSAAQLGRLAIALESMGPLEVPLVVSAFLKSGDEDVGLALVDALGRSGKFESLSDAQFDALAKRFPPAGGAIDRLRAERRDVSSTRQTSLRLSQVERDLPTGGVASGRQVFLGRKAACNSCHRAGSDGGTIGPDLSKVGARRNQRDLLEAVLFPSASIARGFESQVIRTKAGHTLTGLVARETAESIFLRTTDQREVRLRRRDIEAQKSSDQSIMPSGLERAMSQQELADLLAYLGSLK
jgi:putative membrane-bound dehydrogenase-like protein